MTTRDALQRAICEAPDDDAPRLIYADWLDENGDPQQAEFIRLQIEMSPVPWLCEGEDYGLLRQREVWTNIRKWRFARNDWMRLGLEEHLRGFCPNWRGTAAEFLKTAPNYWRLGPTHSIRIFFERKSEVCTPEALDIAQSEWLGRVREIELIGDRLSDEWVAEFIKSPSAGNWSSIRLDSPRLTDASCDALAALKLERDRCWVQISPSRRITARGSATIASHFRTQE